MLYIFETLSLCLKSCLPMSMYICGGSKFYNKFYDQLRNKFYNKFDTKRSEFGDKFYYKFEVESYASSMQLVLVWWPLVFP